MPNDFYNAIQQLRRNRAQEPDTPQGAGIQTPELDKATGNTAQSAPALQISPRWKTQGQSQQNPRGMETYSPIMLAMQNPNAAIPTEQQWNARQNVGQTQSQPTQTQSTGSTGSRPGGRQHQRRTSTQAVNLAGETAGPVEVAMTPEQMQDEYNRVQQQIRDLDTAWRTQDTESPIMAAMYGTTANTMSREEYDRQRRELQEKATALETGYRTAKRDGPFTGTYARELNYAEDRESPLSVSHFAEIMNRADFAQKSQPGERAGGKFFTTSDQELYNYINDIDGARRSYDIRAIRGMGPEYAKYQLMTPEEIKVYNYYANSGDTEGLKEFLGWLEPQLNRQWYTGRQEAMDELVGQNAGTKVLGSAATVLAQPARALTGAAATIQDIYRADRGLAIDPYSPLHQFNRLNQGIRAEVGEDMSGAGQFLYNTVMSAADSAMNSLNASGIASTFGLTGEKAMELTNKLGALLMSNEVVSTSIAEAKDKGYSDVGAVCLGLLRGGIETASEMIGGEWAIKNIKAHPDQFLRTMMINGVPEGVEENMSSALNEAVNLLIDNSFGTEESYIGQAYKHYQEEGKENPGLWVVLTVLEQEGLNFLGGALSTVGTTGVQWQNYNSGLSMSANALHTDTGTVQQLMEELGTDNPAAVGYMAELADVSDVDGFRAMIREVNEAAQEIDAATETGGQQEALTPIAETVLGNENAQTDTREPTPGTNPRAERAAQIAEEQRRVEDQRARDAAWRDFFRQGPNQQTQTRTEEGGQSSQTRQTAERGQTEEITSEDVRRQQEEAARQRAEAEQPVVETGERTPTQEPALNTPQAPESADTTEGQAGTSPIAEAILHGQTAAEIQRTAPIARNPRVSFGKTGTTYTNRRGINFQYAVVPVDSLVASNDRFGNTNPNYPAEFQPRDRKRQTSQVAINQMANLLNPVLLEESKTAQNGAPIITGDGVVISGNGRTTAIDAAYAAGRGNNYRQYIMEHAGEFGLDPNTIPENGVLVRVIPEGEDLAALARELNETTTATMSATENAQADAEKLTDAVISLLDTEDADITGGANASFVQRFIQSVVPETERGAMIDANGHLSKAGLTRIQNAIFARAYGNVDRLARLAEYTDDTAKNITKALVIASNAALQYQNSVETGDSYDVDITAEIMQALDLYEQSRQEGKDFDDFMAQASLFGASDSAFEIAEFIAAHKRSFKALSEYFFDIYAEAASRDANQFSLFGGETSEPTVSDILRGAEARYLGRDGKNSLGYVPGETSEKRAQTPEGLRLDGTNGQGTVPGRSLGVNQNKLSPLLQSLQEQATAQIPSNQQTEAEPEPAQPTPAPSTPSQGPNPNQNGGTPQTGTVRSQSEANTIQAIDKKLDTPQEVRNPLYYNPQSEAESVARARDFLQNGYTSNAPAQVNSKLTPEQRTSLQDAGNRLGGGYGQAMSDMQGSSVWSTVQQDMSTLIFDALAEDAQRTGNWDAYEAWRIVDQEHGTEIARTLQARGKRTRGAKYDILDYVSNVINEAGLSEEAKNAALTKTLQYAREFQTLDETDENALKDFIRRASQARGTGTIIKPYLNKLLKGQSAEYLYKIAEAQCKAMANDFMPVSVGDKLKTWQTIAQLLKVTTAARNLGGNEIFGLMDASAGNIFGVALDRLVAKSTGARSVPLDLRWLSSAQRKAAVDAAKKSALEIALDVDIGSAGNKYDPRGRSFRMSGNVAERFMSRLEQLLSYSLTTSDQFFHGGIEANAAALDRLNAGNEAALAQSREAMERMAKYRLFQNQGAAATVARTFHDALNMAGIGGEVKNGKRTGGFGVADAIMPYTTVPANLAVKPFEWSPVGIVKGGVELAQVIKDAKNGKLNLSKQNDAVMSIARGASGTAVVALLAALIKSGIVKRSDDDKDYDVTKARQAEGRTETQWNLDATLRWLKGGSRDWKESDDLISLNWAEPMNAFMDIAALAVDAQKDGDATVNDYASAYAYGAIQAFMEMPMMETMQTITNAVKYADAGDMDKVGNALQSAAISATTGMMPGIVSQVGRVMDPVTRDTGGDTFMERFTNAIMNATPGLREKLPEKLDSFGNPIVAENPLYNALNNLALPGAVREYAPKDIVQALDNVYDETGNSNFYPDYKAPNAFSYGGTNYELTTEEKRAYMTAFGESYNKLMEDTLNSRQYDRMSASEKAEVFGNLRTLAMNQARGEIVEGRGGQYETDKDGILELSNIPSYYMNKAQYSAAIQNKDYDQIDKMIKSWNGVPDDVAEKLTSGTGPMHYLGKVYEASKAGINSKTYYETTDAVKAIPSAGEGDSPLTWQKVEYIGNLSSMPEKQKDFFMKQYFEGGSVTKYETCRSQGYRPQDIAAFYKLKNTIKGDDNNGDGKADKNSAKNKTIAAAVKYGFSQAQAEYLYGIWK